MKTVAILPAGGAGRRMGSVTPKQYLSLGGIPLVAHTLRIFQKSPCIDSVILVVPEDGEDEVRRDIVLNYGFSKVRDIVVGGRERQDSVRNALARVDDDDEIVVVHDGVRPLVTVGLIGLIVEKAAELGAVAAGIDIRDTVKRVDVSGRILETVPREHLWLTQTPQAFRKNVILAAYRQACETGFYGTDDASLVEKNGFPVWMIHGDRDNIKVTTKEDLDFCEMVMQHRGMQVRA